MCFRFIFYKNPNYRVESDDEVRTFSGIYVCAAVPFEIGSLRHDSSKWFNPQRSHITVFSQLNFGGQFYTVTKQSNRGLEIVQPTLSFITVGKDAWLVKANNEQFCVKPPDKDPETEREVNYVCVMPNATDIFDAGRHLSGPWTITEITKGCEEGDGTKYTPISTCFDYRKGEMQEPAVPKLRKYLLFE